MTEQYPFIVLEGVDCAGKTTTAKLLAAEIAGEYRKTPFGPTEQMRGYFDRQGNVTARFLFYLSTVCLASEEVKILTQEKPVILDRYVHSTLAYHTIAGISAESFVNLTVLRLKPATLTVCLTASASTRVMRARERGDNAPNFEQESSQNYLDRVQELLVSYSDITLATDSLSPRDVVEKIKEQLPLSQKHCLLLD